MGSHPRPKDEVSAHTLRYEPAPMAPLMRLCRVAVPEAVMVLSAAYAHLKVRHFNGKGVAASVLPVSGSCPAKFDPMRVM